MGNRSIENALILIDLDSNIMGDKLLLNFGAKFQR